MLRERDGSTNEYTMVDHWLHLFSHWVRQTFSEWWRDNVGEEARMEDSMFFLQLKSFVTMEPYSFCGVSYLMDPVEWWSKQTMFPLLKFVALHVLSAPASSFSVERLWSTVGRVLDKRRARLTYECMEMQVLLHEWYKLAELFPFLDGLAFELKEEPAGHPEEAAFV